MRYLALKRGLYGEGLRVECSCGVAVFKIKARSFPMKCFDDLKGVPNH